MPDRYVPHFQEELEQLKTRLLEMGGLAEDRVRSAVEGLVEREAAVVDRVLTGDVPINQLHIEIDSRCFKLLPEGGIRVRGVKVRFDQPRGLGRIGHVSTNGACVDLSEGVVQRFAVA